MIKELFLEYNFTSYIAYQQMDESFGSKNVKSSTAFFTQLQDQVQSHIASQAQAKRKKQKQQFEAKRLKL